MVTEETMRHRDAVSEVLEELDSFLTKKSTECSAKLDAPYNNVEPTDEELLSKVWEGHLAVAYAKMHNYVRQQEIKYLVESNRMMCRDNYELKIMLNEE